MLLIGSSLDRFHLDRANASIEGARLALACAYSSSEEFEASIIRERRAAGAYGPKPSKRFLLWGSALAAFFVLFFAVL